MTNHMILEVLLTINLLYATTRQTHNYLTRTLSISVVRVTKRDQGLAVTCTSFTKCLRHPVRHFLLIVVGPCHHGWGVLRFRIEERPPIRRVAANKLNKQSRTADEGWSYS